MICLFLRAGLVHPARGKARSLRGWKALIWACRYNAICSETIGLGREGCLVFSPGQCRNSLPTSKPQGSSFFFPVTSLFSTENINSACVRVVISCGPRCLYTVAFYRDRGAGTFDRHWVLHPEKGSHFTTVPFYLENGRTQMPVVSKLHSTVLIYNPKLSRKLLGEASSYWWYVLFRVSNWRSSGRQGHRDIAARSGWNVRRCKPVATIS